MSVIDRAVEKNANLSYVALNVIECFKDAGLDLNYIDDKISEFSDLSAKYWIKQPPIPAPTIPVILVRAIPL
ncbi:TPA: hypothetical protein ACHKET_003873 [Acinetobacter baumannii]|uniref:hypothetical protein n=1 Tax=Acinetobacter baumannii TaxID=470 RepID=UPI001EF318A3|nr:hypothetical protein [Acinetobacter baumannii]MDF7765906.1 hypothetical protein [Acinetobacter baumannii]HCQ9668980.1 hypothetical protein [Acinetobacter baumannii]